MIKLKLQKSDMDKIKCKVTCNRTLLKNYFYLLDSLFNPNTQVVSNDYNVLICNENNMNRVFIDSSDKITSFKFIFRIYFSSEQLIVKYKNITLEQPLISALITVNNYFIDNHIDKKIEIELNNNINSILEDYDSIIDEVKKIYLEIISEDYGYLRFDRDYKNTCEIFHPQYHIDIFYENNNSIKFGFSSDISIEALKDLIHKDTKCAYLSYPN